jgi:hypothetical protein
MPRYEIVAHVAQDLACDTPEQAAAVFRERLLSEGEETVTLRHLAVWRLTSDTTGWEVPTALRRQLAQFFAEVERCAAGAEEAFRARVESILAGESQPAEGRSAQSGGHRAPDGREIGSRAVVAAVLPPSEPGAVDRR